MNIGDKALVKGEVVEIRQTLKGYSIKVRPDYKENIDEPFRADYDAFIVDESCIINETDQVNQMAEDYQVFRKSLSGVGSGIPKKD